LEVLDDVQVVRQQWMIRVVENPFDMERAAKEAIERGATVEDGKICVKATERIPWMTLDNATPLPIAFMCA
jgi:hypothetical protein